jgi:hypothetical protein
MFVVQVALLPLATADDFRVKPYLQYPARGAVTVRWLTTTPGAGRLTVQGHASYTSEPVRADALAYQPGELALLPAGASRDAPFLHRVRVVGLEAGRRYRYVVQQGACTAQGVLAAAPADDASVRLAVYADSETEPESLGAKVEWPAAAAAQRPAWVGGRYLVDQHTGLRANLALIEAWEPDLVLVAGDLVETGGEQRDWDEFWRHHAGEWGQLASKCAVLATLGNHENWSASHGGYAAAAARSAVARYTSYFEYPDNGAPPAQRGRYWRMDLGPLTLIALDSSSGVPHGSANDSNHLLVSAGEQDEHGVEGTAPDFNPGSQQYAWLVAQLRAARQRARFVFVAFHHTPLSVGPHGQSPEHDRQSGTPLRALLPLFVEQGVDAVFCGHDEMYERSVWHGLQVYDLGIGGDGLRGPHPQAEHAHLNPHQAFLAHRDAPEIWRGDELISGGKHYGHLQVEIFRDADQRWYARCVPIIALPRTGPVGLVQGWRRASYDDVILLPCRQR